MEQYQKAFLTLATRYHALQFGQFTLKSGRESDYFINLGRIADGPGLLALGRCYAQTMVAHGIECEVLFGPAYKGIALATATAMALAVDFGQHVGVAFNRKERKDHGEGGQFVGAPLTSKTLILDDVLTAGSATREAIALLEQTPVKLCGVLVAVDRQEMLTPHNTAREVLRDSLKLPIWAIVNASELRSWQLS